VVTSGNAESIVKKVPPEFEILFVPDKHLGMYLEEVTGRKMILWDGACMVHEIFSLGDLLAIKKKLPSSLVFAHPECPANIRAHSDFVGGTEAMLNKIATTEPNMMWQMQHRYPMHHYHPVPGITCACNKCPHMARNTLEKLKACLVDESPEITWDPCFDRAREVLTRSLLN
jgi:quinolinate synthase